MKNAVSVLRLKEKWNSAKPMFSSSLVQNKELNRRRLKKRRIAKQLSVLNNSRKRSYLSRKLKMKGYR